MHVVAYSFEVTVARAVDDQRLVSPAKQMAEDFVPPVKPAGVSSQEPFHPSDQVGLRGFHYEMKMIGHQDECVHPPTCLSARLGERLEKQFPMWIPFGDGLASVTSVHEVVNPSLILQSNLPCPSYSNRIFRATHVTLPRSPSVVNSKN